MGMRFSFILYVLFVLVGFGESFYILHSLWLVAKRENIDFLTVSAANTLYRGHFRPIDDAMKEGR